MAVHHSTSGVGAGAWLHAPTRDITPLTNEEFTTASLLRLDKPCTTQPTNCHRATTNDTCNQPVNTHLDHALHCKYGPHRIRRHNQLRDTLAKLIYNITEQQPLTEQIIVQNPTHTSHIHEDTPLNRSDITFYTADSTIHLDLMVTCATTTQALAGSTGLTAAPGYAATQAELHKHNKYHPHPITPIVFETHGRFGQTTLQFLRDLTATLPTTQEQTATYHYCLQQLSTTLQRNNAQTINTHLGHSAAPAA